MKKIKLSREDMLIAFWEMHAWNHTTEEHAFVDELLMCAIGAGWLEFDPKADTMTWLGISHDDRENARHGFMPHVFPPTGEFKVPRV